MQIITVTDPAYVAPGGEPTTSPSFNAPNARFFAVEIAPDSPTPYARIRVGARAPQTILYGAPIIYPEGFPSLHVGRLDRRTPTTLRLLLYEQGDPIPPAAQGRPPRKVEFAASSSQTDAIDGVSEEAEARGYKWAVVFVEAVTDPRVFEIAVLGSGASASATDHVLWHVRSAVLAGQTDAILVPVAGGEALRFRSRRLNNAAPSGNLLAAALFTDDPPFSLNGRWVRRYNVQNGSIANGTTTQLFIASIRGFDFVQYRIRNNDAADTITMDLVALTWADNRANDPAAVTLDSTAIGAASASALSTSLNGANGTYDSYRLDARNAAAGPVDSISGMLTFKQYGG